MTHRLRRAAVIAALATLTLSTAACGGGFNGTSTPQQTSGPAKLAGPDRLVRRRRDQGGQGRGRDLGDEQRQHRHRHAGSGHRPAARAGVRRWHPARRVLRRRGACSPTTRASAPSSRTRARCRTSNDFYPSLRNAFTYKGQLYCIPKDFSTLALEINTDLWAKAGLTDADIPTTWDQLTAVSKKLKAAGITPLATADTRDRLGAFMVQAGGWLTNTDGTQATADTPQNVQALTYVQGLLKQGLAVYPKQVDAGWGGEAFGKGKTAMAMEGNWIEGAMQSDYPNINYKSCSCRPARPARARCPSPSAGASRPRASSRTRRSSSSRR